VINVYRPGSRALDLVVKTVTGATHATQDSPQRRITPRFFRRCSLLFAAGCCMALSIPANAAVYSVGQPSDRACTHTSLQAAIDAASANASTQTHTIRIARPLIEVSMDAIDDAFRIVDPQADLLLEGNYASCTDSFPQSNGSRTTLALSAGSVGRVLRVQSVPNRGAQRRVVTLRNLHLRGGNSTSFPMGVAFGGGVRVSGAVSLRILSSYVTNNRSSRGGGIAVMGGAELLLDFSQVGGNIAEGLFGRGGGIYCGDPHSEVIINEGAIIGNSTPGNGGGVHLDGCGGLRSGISRIGGIAPVLIANNIAGVPDSSNGGLGGGVYIENSVMSFTDAQEQTFSLLMENNTARRGGALYSTGSATGLSLLNVLNAAFINNTGHDRGGVLYALGRIDALFGHGRPQRCTSSLSVRGTRRSFETCSLMAGNYGGVVHLINRTGEYAWVQIQRSELAYNEGIRVPLANIVGGAFSLTDSVAHSNRALGGGTGVRTPSLLQLFAPGPHYVLRSTLISNDAPQMALIDNASLNVAGSILHDPSMRVFRATNGGILVHRGCLLIHPLQSDASLLEEIAPGFFSEGTYQADPQLGQDFTPSSISRAIDGCSSERAGGELDLYNQPRRTDIPGVVNFPFAAQIPGSYVHDLGAVERSLVRRIQVPGLRDLTPRFNQLDLQPRWSPAVPVPSSSSITPHKGVGELGRN